MFEVVAEVGEGSHVHGEIDIRLSCAEVENIITFLKKNDKNIYNLDSFDTQYPELGAKIDQTVRAEIPHMLSDYFFNMGDMTSYWYDFPAEIKSIAEAELGHPLGNPEKKTNGEPTEKDKEFEDWIREHADEIMSEYEAEYQEREENFKPIGGEAPEEEEPSIASSDDSMWIDVYSVKDALGEYEDMVVDITFMGYSRFREDEHEEHFIAQIGKSTDWSLELIYPLNIEAYECFAGSLSTPAHEIKIAAVSEEDMNTWRQEAHRHSELCRRCDKEDWLIDHPELKGVDYEQERAYIFIDSEYDLRNARIDAAERYKGQTSYYWRH